MRLKLSNKARKRVACAVTDETSADAHALAYFVGSDCAVDRLLLAGKPELAADLEVWQPPTLPIRGGALIERGLRQGPDVARTLQRIERRWVEAGFPSGAALEQIIQEALASAGSHE